MRSRRSGSAIRRAGGNEVIDIAKPMRMNVHSHAKPKLWRYGGAERVTRRDAALRRARLDPIRRRRDFAWRGGQYGGQQADRRQEGADVIDEGQARAIGERP